MILTDFTLRVLDSVTARNQPWSYTFDGPEPYVVYTALKKQFGAPNGLVGKYTQWSYEFALPNAMIRLQDWKLYGWMLEVYSDDKKKTSAETIKDDVLALFVKEANRSETLVKNLAKASSRSMVQNPFRIYFDSASNLVAMAEQHGNQQQRDTLCRSAFFLFLSSFEGVLNLIYDLYLKPSIRENKEGRETVIRAGLDQKLLFAPVYCQCFTGETLNIPPDIYQQYKALRSLRNNFIHANVTDAMRTSIIKHDQMNFLLEPHRIKEYDLPLLVSGLTVAHLRFTQTTIIGMKNAIVAAMNVHYRHDFAQALEQEEIIIERGNDGISQIRKHI